MTAAKYVYFDANIPKSEPMISEHKVDWRERLQEDCISATTNQSNVSQKTHEISDDDDDDDDDVEEEYDIQEKGVSFVESLATLGKRQKGSFLDDDSHMMLSALIRKFEDL